jgi:alpha-glucosidase (family GH31 glycosyl hydrolase)
MTDPANFNGVMGLVEQVSGSLFLPDGIYSLWSLDTADPAQNSKLPASNMYGVHPFFMGRATDKTWFGVFLNLAAAQDWTIRNDNTTGVVGLKTLAVGGMVDLYIMMGPDPSTVT